MIYTDRGLHEECGIFGIYNNSDANILTYYGLHSLQHRGQEAAGIITFDSEQVMVHKGEGLVADVFPSSTLEKLQGSGAIGHVRYSTAGGSGYENVQPFLYRSNKETIGIAHNGNIVNATMLRDQLEENGSIFQATSDTEILAHLLKKYHGTFIERLIQSLNDLDGAFAFIVLHNDTLYAMRDKNGLRPLSVAKLPGGGFAVSSETCAFDIVGGTFIRDIEPGEIVAFSGDKLVSHYYSTATEHDMCMMEYVYFSRPDSAIEGVNVHTARKRTGAELFLESHVDADIVVGVPDSSTSAAIGYAEASHIPYEMGLVKNRYVGRTFIQPTQALRERGVRMKLSAVRAIVEGKKIILIDDSIVRGTTSRRIVELLKTAGALEVHVRIASPPIKFPCFYGVDTSTFDELISNRMDVATLCETIGADSLVFLSEEGLVKAIGRKTADGGKCGGCMACFTGKFPTAVYDELDNANKIVKD
ncbi:amidophosphoribosyltransferase [Culicoidibacter larvae]|uniref:Amidophosphoribosyltransferase n=1 Tax=Culicoidibacter larvae TaxID=2579976 RepID=A0A5R8QCN5_9FIRM|nr:amidophosphoribosyltransferase [Culicoidibacter larvae]TLG74331.1 amidophosphoribosyltransferase [Culicoidibacter larvae]